MTWVLPSRGEQQVNTMATIWIDPRILGGVPQIPVRASKSHSCWSVEYPFAKLVEEECLLVGEISFVEFVEEEYCCITKTIR